MARSKINVKTTKEISTKPAYQWHAHSYTDALAILKVTEDGLDNDEIKNRQKEHGLNVFTEALEPNFLSRVFVQFKSPLTAVLLVAALTTLALQEFIDASVIVFALMVAISVGIIQEGKASRAFKKLSNSQEHIAFVIRDGNKQQITADEVVVGDIIKLEAGVQVPADLRLIQTKKLSINEASLTGEWLVVEKDVVEVLVGSAFAEQSCMAWMGTYVAMGYGTGVVVATGDDTAIGKLAQEVQEVAEVETPLKEEMSKLSRIMLYIIAVLVGVIFVIGLIGGQSLHDMLLLSIAIAVASIPEGLPAAVTIILAVGMEAILKRGGLVRNLLAAETLGSTTYVLTDKTGTLTKAKMAVRNLIYANAGGVDTYKNETTRTKSWKKDIVALEMLEVGLTASSAFVDYGKDAGTLRGDPVEIAILEATREMDSDSNVGSLVSTRVDYLAFTSENRFAAGLVPNYQTNEYRLCINGSPEMLLEKAQEVYTKRGSRIMEDVDRRAFESAIRLNTKQGRRLVAVGYKRVSYDEIPPETENLINDLVFVGIFVIDDPVRKGIRDAINGVKGAGAKIILLTGDNPETALSVAREVGIAKDGEVALTGADLEGMTDEEILYVLEEVHVLARVLPNQKMRIATLLQRNGEIVAMTGDGVNDAPALMRANIGIAIGTGTEVAKEASDLVLVRDSFSTIHAAIEEGRRIIANLKKVVGYLLSTSFSEVALIGAALVVGAPVPILPTQILWANIIEEGLMSVAFAFEPGEKNAMKRLPQDIHEEGILSKDMIKFILFVTAVLGILLVSLYFYLRIIELPLTEIRSVMFLAVSIDSLFIAFSFRSLYSPLWRIPLRTNMFFLASFIISLSLLLLVLTIPFFQYLLSYTPLPFNDILMVIGLGMLSLLTVELGKGFFFKQKL